MAISKADMAPQLTQFYQEIGPLEGGTAHDAGYKDGVSSSILNIDCFNYTNAIGKIVAALKKDHIGQRRAGVIIRDEIRAISGQK